MGDKGVLELLTNCCEVVWPGCTATVDGFNVSSICIEEVDETIGGEKEEAIMRLLEGDGRIRGL